MTPISGINTAALPPEADGRTAGLPAQRPEGEPGHPVKPRMDEYVPEEKQEPSGRYWPGRDGDGRPRICFDGPGRAGNSPEEAPAAGSPQQDRKAEGPEKKSTDKKAETCTGDTGKVDRELEKLKRERAELERRLDTETDEAKRRELERRLAKVEDELRQKDNDGYRRRHTVFS